MILSTQTERLSGRVGDIEAIRILAQAGFDAIDFSMFYMQEDQCPLNQDDYKEYMLRLKEEAEKQSVFFNQAHAPFPSAAYGNEEYNEKVWKRIVRSLECASILNVKQIVVHPISCPEGVDQFNYNMEFYNRLLPYCKKFNIKDAIENMWGYGNRRKCIIPNGISTGSELVRYYDALDPEWFVVCLDLGHCGLIGEEAYKAIRTLGKNRLKALHVHDNNYCDDTHTLPYMGLLDWDGILKALADIAYEGEFTFEADNFLNRIPDDFLPAASRFMCETGRYLIKKLESYCK